jgi:hypothetical protein
MLCIAASAPSVAMAQGSCATVLTRAQLRNKFDTVACVCGAPGANRPALQWNETHVPTDGNGASGSMAELGMEAPGGEIAVGTWTVTAATARAPGILTYNHTGGPSFSWAVDGRPTGNLYRFCNVGGATGPFSAAFPVKIKGGACSVNC